MRSDAINPGGYKRRAMLHRLEPLHDEFAYQLGLIDELEAEQFDSQRERIRRLIYRSRARFRAMEDILWMYPYNSAQAVEEINKKYPINMLPHTHPRRIRSLYEDTERTISSRH